MSKWILPVILVLGLISLPLAFENEAPFSQTSTSPQSPEGGSAAATPVETVATEACCPDPSHSHMRLSPADSPGQRRLEDIPESPFRQQLEAAEPAIREQALAHFNAFGMAIEDADSLHIGPDGSLYYACRAPAQLAEPVFLDEPEPEAAALLAEASVPVASPPVYHSKPGAPYVIYLDFNGATISGTAWNSGGNTLNAYVWSKDSDTTTFSDDEQNIIRRIWQRMSEDYAPFNINVTTDPAFDPDITDGLNNVGWVLFTRDEDTGGTAMPAKGAGGVAYVGVFGNSSYASYYSPAFVYADNLGPNIEHFMAEAGSHEMGHNMGLSHDGGSNTEYYGGHSAGSLRWGPIMGSSYNDDITTWSKGEYTGANQFQDDLAIIANRVGYRPDEAGSSLATAAGLAFIGDSVVDPLTRDYIGDDPNEGIIESPTDIDTWSFSTDAGSVSFTVETFVAEDTRYSEGPNLDIKLTLKDALENVIATSDPQTSVSATINAVVQAGTYSLSIEGTGYGDPLASPPTGYTDYGSLGMYFITGNAPQPDLPPIVIAQSPAADSDPESPQSSLTLSFSEPMDTASFDFATDVLSFSGPQGVDLKADLQSASWNIDGTELTLQFTEQSTEGYYRLVLSAGLTDLDGNAMDQDDDGIFGEAFEDAFQATFRIAAQSQSGIQTLYFADMQTDPQVALDPGWEWGNPNSGALGGPDNGVGDASVLATNLDGAYAANLSSGLWMTLPPIDASDATQIELSFARWLGIAFNQSGAPSGRHADYARIQYSTDGNSWSTLWSSSSAIGDTGWTTQTIGLPAAAENQATLHIRFGIESDETTESFGWNLDNIEISANVVSLGSIVLAPVVFSQTPDNVVTEPQSSLFIEFSQPMSTSSFSLGDIAAFSGPSGTITPTGFSWVFATTLRIDFPEQSEDGVYTLVLNPGIEDVFGTPLDQDTDLIPGEPVDDQYTGTFTIDIPTPAKLWREEFFGSTANAGDGADDNDFDKDGLPNVLERAFATDPTLAGSAYRPQQSVMEDLGLQYPAITYKRPAGGTGTTGVDYAIDGLTYTVEYNTDLASTWESGDITVVSIDPPVDDMETVTVRLNTDLATETRQFIRLSVVGSN